MISLNPKRHFMMMLETSSYLDRLESKQFSIFTQKFHNNLAKTLHSYEADIVYKDNNTYLLIFDSASNAIWCALKIQSDFKYITTKYDGSFRKLQIGISCTNSHFDNILRKPTVGNTAYYMCEWIPDTIVISKEVKSHFEMESINAEIDTEQIRVLSTKDEFFLKRVMNFLNDSWSLSEFSMNLIPGEVGYSPSGFYKKIKRITGKTPNSLFREFRLKKAIKKLYQKGGNISEIARQSGFKSRSYFTKCFENTFGILPSRYIQRQH
ncbi:helix-turn-helix domain-containing protein [Eudoraea sp.]|uniref:helix-turn-helix domain-containing protein n=1 Tax=Eudoraea sp. TaxID=1979955 RepID=UPI003C73A860